VKAILIVAFSAASVAAYAGEDSTERSRAGGTGPAFYEADCGLERFVGQQSDPELQGPCLPASAAAGATEQREPAPQVQQEPQKPQMPGRERAE
jgi:hypothetical protein